MEAGEGNSQSLVAEGGESESRDMVGIMENNLGLFRKLINFGGFGLLGF
jgi:hypothetical protein